MRNLGVRLFLTAAVLSGAWCSSASATLVTYAVDSNSSSLALDGILDLLPAISVPLEAQPPNGLLAAYMGSITVNLDTAGASVQFDSATALDAIVSASYLPGPANGDYGFSAIANNETRFGAIRDVVFTMGGAALVMSGNPGSPAGASFDLSAATSTATAGTVDTDFVGTSGFDLAGISALSVSGTGTLSTVGLTQTLTLDVTFHYDVALSAIPPARIDGTFSGTIVATREIPEPATLGMLALGVLLVSRRNRRAGSRPRSI